MGEIFRMSDEPQKHHNGGGGGMETRIAKLESDVEHIKTDISDIKIDIRDIRTEMKDIRIEIKDNLHKMVGVTLGSAGVIIAVIMGVFSIMK